MRVLIRVENALAIYKADNNYCSLAFGYVLKQESWQLLLTSYVCNPFSKNQTAIYV